MNWHSQTYQNQKLQQHLKPDCRFCIHATVKRDFSGVYCKIGHGRPVFECKHFLRWGATPQ